MPFQDLAAHRRLTDLLSRSIERGALPPSLIFAGPEGVGKRATAIAVAQALNCTVVTGGDFCGSCTACVRISRGIHPDVLLVEPGDTGSIKIEQVREVIDRVAYRPFEGRHRVVIIDAADALVPAAQNALLKTLEEPPSASSFILLTSRPDVLLATVRSRCIRLWFADLAADAVDAEARDVAARVLAQAAAAHDPRRRIDSAKTLLEKTGASGAADREQLASHLRAMASLLRDIALVAAGGAQSLVHADLRASIDRLVSAYGGDRAVRAFAAIDRALAALDRNAGVKTVADWLVLQL